MINIPLSFFKLRRRRHNIVCLSTNDSGFSLIADNNWRLEQRSKGVFVRRTDWFAVYRKNRDLRWLCRCSNLCMHLANLKSCLQGSHVSLVQTSNITKLIVTWEIAPAWESCPSNLTVEPHGTALWRGIKERNNVKGLKVGAASPKTKLQDEPYLLLQSQHLESLKIGQHTSLLSSIPSLRPSALIPFLVHLLFFPSLCHRGSPSCTG